jgi:hypothetical protein
MPHIGRPGQIRFAAMRQAVHQRRMAHHSPLDDPKVAAHAWGRFRRQMRITGWVTLAVEIAVLSFIFIRYGMVSIHLFIGLGLAIALSAFLISALTGLVFLSSGTGHDDAVSDQQEFRKKRD